MFTDIVGYTALMGSDEEKAFEVLRKNKNIHKPFIAKYKGKWLKEMGDGILASFDTASDAVRCAGEIQNKAIKEGIRLRIGIHTGEVVFKGNDVLGDGVNVASRLEDLAEEGQIFISDSVYKDIKNKAGITADFIDERTLKNVEEPIKIYKAYYQPAELKEPDADQIQKRLQKNFSYYLISGLLITIIIILVWYNLPDRLTTVTEKSIVVLPFKNDSPDQENEYFCNGMMEEILTNLQKISDLRVKSRTSAEKYRYRTDDVTDIGKELNVAFVLEGSVRKINDNIRITTQLIDTKSGDHLWAETYNGKYTEKIFDFQSRTARTIATSLQAIITPQEREHIDKIPTTNMLAYDLQLKGYEYIRAWRYEYEQDSSNLKLAMILADEALKIDPDYIGAMNLKALISTYIRDYDSALYYYDKIYHLDPEHYSSYTGKGYLYMRYLNNTDSAFKYIMKGISLAPNDPWVNLTLAQIYSKNNNTIIKSLPYFEKAYELDGESSPEISLQIAIVMASIGDYPSALKYMKIALNIRLECAMIGYYNYLLLCRFNYDAADYFLDSICNITDCEKICSRQRYMISVFQKDFKKAEEYYKEAPETLNIPLFISDLLNACFFYEIGRKDEANILLENVIEHNLNLLNSKLQGSGISNACWMLTGAYSILNDKVNALHYLSQLEESGFFVGWQDFIMIFPAFKNLWDDPEFKTIITRVQNKKSAIRAQVREMEEQGKLNL